MTALIVIIEIFHQNKAGYLGKKHQKQLISFHRCLTQFLKKSRYPKNNSKKYFKTAIRIIL